jgi:hypothetical protein
MRHALVIVECGITSSKQAELEHFATTVEATAKQRNLSIERLNAGVYLVPIDTGLHALLLLVHQADNHRFQIRTLFFDQEPPFVITKPA